MAQEVTSIPQQLRSQAEWAQRLGSPLYETLLSHAAGDYEAGGPVRDLLEPLAGEARGLAIPLQLMAAVHRLVLEGSAPELGRFYPSAGGSLALEACWEPFRRTLIGNMDNLRTMVKRPVQTNDPGRSGSLLGGFLAIASRTSLPLRLLEIGTSAGLNLCWDRFRYEWTGGAWGEPGSPVRLENVFVEGAPPEAAVRVSERSGCDPEPVDANTAEGRLTLLACTWPDQTHRIRLLEAAIAVAREMTYGIDRARAADWLKTRLARPVAGVTSVVFHSVVWPYLPEDERTRVTEIIEEAGRRATPEAPVAWLRMELLSMTPGKAPELRLRIYPGFAEQVLATTSFHTPAVRWMSTSA